MKNRVLNEIIRDGFSRYGVLPELLIHSQEDYISISWNLPEEKMEVRVRQDGKINWYYQRPDRCGGNEGWSSYRPALPSLTPWPQEK